MNSVRLSLLSLALIAGVLLSAPLTAQVMTVNGFTQASVAQGRDVMVSVTAEPGVPLFVAFNVDPGPTLVGKDLVPIGNGPTLLVTHSGVPVPANGIFEDSMRISINPALEGVVLYGVAAVADPRAPAPGLSFSNGISMTFTRFVEAGDSNAGFVGHRIPLDASATLLDGPLPADSELIWSIVQAPAGHSAVLEGEDSVYPTLTPDLPGLYRLELCLRANGTMGGAFNTTEIHVYDLDLQASALFSEDANPSVTAAFAGTPGSSYGLTGLDADADGDGVVSGSEPAGDAFTSFFFEATSPRGSTARRHLPVINGIGAGPGEAVDDVVAINLRDGAFVPIETAVESAAAGFDLASLIDPLFEGLEAIPLVDVPAPFPPGATLFSADVTPTSLGFDPGIGVDITPVPGALELALSFQNLQFVFEVSGETLLTGNYSDVGTLNVPVATLTFETTTTVVDGEFTSTVDSSNLDLSGATLTFATGGTILDTFSTQILAALIPALEDLVEVALANALSPLLDGVLNALPQDLDLGGTSLTATASSVTYPVGGLTIGLRLGLEAEGLPTGFEYLVTPNGPASFSPTVPGTTDDYALGLALGDEVANLALAAAHAAAPLSFSVEGPLDIAPPFPPVELNAGAVALIIPGTGFESFDPAAPVRLDFVTRVAPHLRFGSTVNLVLPDVEVRAMVEVEPGREIPALTFGLFGSLEVTPVIDLVNSELSFESGAATVSSYPIGFMPGVNAANSVTALGALIGFLAPDLAGAIPPLPLPELPLGGGVELLALEVAGPVGDYIALYLDLGLASDG